MKFNKLYTILLISATTLSMIACSDYEDTEVASPVPEGGTQAFISANTPADLSYTPEKDQSFEVTIGRHNETEATSFFLEITDEGSFFTLPSEVSFAAGETVKTITISFDMEIGESGDLTLIVPDADRYIYGLDSVTISVLRDYTWEDAGIVSFTSAWAGGTADLSVQQAKEGDNLYRIVSPYYVLEPDYCPNPGYHVEFTLDDSFNAKSVITSDIGEVATGSSNWWLYWDSTGPHASDCTFTNDGNSFSITGRWAYGTSAENLTDYASATESFVWTTGYPGIVPE